MSARVVGDIAYILLSEVLGYSTILFDTGAIFSPHVVNYVAGCLDPDDSGCKMRDPESPQVHFTLETWMAGNQRAAALPENIRPPLLSVSDYNLVDGYYLWQQVLDDGLASKQRLSLDFFRSYDANLFKPHEFFDPWEKVLASVPSHAIVRCSAMGPDSSTPRLTANYIRFTNDTDVACHHDDSVWFSPACRANTSECIPLMIQYTFEYAMQISFWLNMPFAVFMVGPGANGDYREYYDAARRGRLLFGWYQPDDSLLDGAGNLPVALNLPATNDLEYIQGVYKTATANYKPRNYCWRRLQEVDRLVHFFASRFNLYGTHGGG